MNTKYIALLRGINISGKNKISMPILKSVLEEQGFEKVATFLNSGNIVFESNIKDSQLLAQKICEAIKAKFDLDISVFVETAAQMENVVSNSPDWWGTGNKEIYDNLIFVIPPTQASEVCEMVGAPSKNIDKIQEYKNHIFWSFELKNYRKSNWWIKTASTSIKDKITIRTANTIKKVLELCKKQLLQKGATQS